MAPVGSVGDAHISQPICREVKLPTGLPEAELPSIRNMNHGVGTCCSHHLSLRDGAYTCLINGVSTPYNLL